MVALGPAGGTPAKSVQRDPQSGRAQPLSGSYVGLRRSRTAREAAEWELQLLLVIVTAH